MDGPDRRFPTARGLYEGAANGGDIDGRRPYGEFVERRPFLATRISRRFGGFQTAGPISRFVTAGCLNRRRPQSLPEGRFRGNSPIGRALPNKRPSQLHPNRPNESPY